MKLDRVLGFLQIEKFWKQIDYLLKIYGGQSAWSKDKLTIANMHGSCYCTK